MATVGLNSNLPVSNNVVFNVDVVETMYDHFSPINTWFPAKHNRQANVAWTASEREKATLGISAQSVLDLRTLVSVLIFRVRLY